MILGTVCARGSSKGVPGKALRKLFNRPLIGIAIECGLKCSELDAVAVSTDDREIADVGRHYGAQMLSLRPAELSQGTTPKWDVFRHILKEWEFVQQSCVDILVDLDVCVPLRRPMDISKCIHRLHTTNAEIVITAFRPIRNPYFNMVEMAGNGGYRIVKQPATPIHNRQQAPVVFGLSPAVYAMRRDALQKYDHWSQARMEIVEIPLSRAWDIDEELDLEIVEFLAAKEKLWDDDYDNR